MLGYSWPWRVRLIQFIHNEWSQRLTQWKPEIIPKTFCKSSKSLGTLRFLFTGTMLKYNWGGWREELVVKGLPLKNKYLCHGNMTQRSEPRTGTSAHNRWELEGLSLRSCWPVSPGCCFPSINNLLIHYCLVCKVLGKRRMGKAKGTCLSLCRMLCRKTPWTPECVCLCMFMYSGTFVCRRTYMHVHMVTEGQP